jgi:hypothetical protein
MASKPTPKTEKTSPKTPPSDTTPVKEHPPMSMPDKHAGKKTAIHSGKTC